MAEKKTTASDLRNMPEGDLLAQIDTLRKEMWQQRLKIKAGVVQQVHELGRRRRQIARIQTVLREKRQST